MIDEWPIDVSGNGAILLGKDVTCDGFRSDYKTRVQTHIHDDHMRDFDRSKGYQEIYMTKPTRELLIAERNADLVIRDNIIGVTVGHSFDVGTSRVTLLKNQHMLGSAQVCVELECGTRVGYSGDFQWPIETTMKVDYLVLDSTNGYPECVREFSQIEAEAALLHLVNDRVNNGPIHIHAFRGTLQRGLASLTDKVSIPLVGSKALCKQVDVYRQHGYAIPEMVDVKSPSGRAIASAGQYIRFYGKGDQVPVDNSNCVSIRLSAFMTGREREILELSSNSYVVAMSDHADFPGILNYVEATGAKKVLCDNTRAGHAIDLARVLTERGLDARPSSQEPSLEWGS